MFKALRRVLSFLRRKRLDDELFEEMQLHLELRRRALIDAGLAPHEADQQARRQFGNVAALRERSRDEWTNPRVISALQDLRFASRLLTRSPALSAVVICTIALGAGINTALFSVVNNMLWRSPDLPAADRLVWLDDGKAAAGLTYPDYVDYRDRTAAFSDLAAYATAEVAARASGDEQPRWIRAVMASGNYFTVLQTQPALGRTFNQTEDLPPHGTPSVVLSDAYWTRRFGRDPGVLGQTIELNLQPFSVVGVMPPAFKGARSPNGNPYVPEVWVPLWSKPHLEPGDTVLGQRTAWWGLQSIGRLRDGVSIAQARAQIGSVATALDREHPGQRHARVPWIARVTDIDTRLFRGETGIVIGALGMASLFVLLIACANVAGLLLARASARRQEIAVRLSLGAGRARIVRLFLAEGLLLSLAGTLLGWIVATWIVLAAFSSGAAQPLAWSFAPDARTVIFTAFLTLVAATGTALLPALQASTTRLHPVLARTEGVRVSRLRAWLVGVEVAASVVLLLATGLLVRGLIHAHAVDPGMPVSHLASIEIDARLHGYDGNRLVRAVQALRHEIDGLPGVISTATMSPAPYSGNRHGTTLRLAGDSDSPGVRLFLADVSGSFADTAGLQVVRGRWFDDRAGDEIVINESLAARLWPSADPLGSRVITGDFNRRSHIVVGVVKDVRYVSLRQANEPFMFRPGGTGSVLIRTTGPAGTIVRPANETVRRLDRRLVATTRGLADAIGEELGAGRRIAAAAAAVGALALVIALAGIAATAAQSVAQRTHEIGVRMTLGARQLDAVSFIVRKTLTPVGVGAIIGLLIASQASRVLVTQLYGVSRFDLFAFAGSLMVVVMAAAAAAWLPARRAASIDPARTLRCE